MMVMRTATTIKMAALEANGSSITSLRAITMISPERMKSVRMAPAMVSRSTSGPRAAAGTSWSWSSCLRAWTILWAPS